MHNVLKSSTTFVLLLIAHDYFVLAQASKANVETGFCVWYFDTWQLDAMGWKSLNMCARLKMLCVRLNSYVEGGVKLLSISCHYFCCHFVTARTKLKRFKRLPKYDRATTWWRQNKFRTYQKAKIVAQTRE